MSDDCYTSEVEALYHGNDWAWHWYWFWADYFTCAEVNE